MYVPCIYHNTHTMLKCFFKSSRKLLPNPTTKWNQIKTVFCHINQWLVIDWLVFNTNFSNISAISWRSINDLWYIIYKLVRKETQKTRLVHNIKQVQRSSVLSTNDCFLKETIFSTCFGVDREIVCYFFFIFCYIVKISLLIIIISQSKHLLYPTHFQYLLDTSNVWPHVLTIKFVLETGKVWSEYEGKIWLCKHTLKLTV